MKQQHISDAIGQLDEELIVEAELLRQNCLKKRLWTKVLTAVAAVCLVVVSAAIFLPDSGKGDDGTMSTTKAFALTEAEYPKMAPYPNEEEFFNIHGMFDSEGFDAVYTAWSDSRRAQSKQYEGYSDGLDGMFLATSRQFLSGAQGQNRIYSPVNVYMALCMLTEITDGESRQQILNLIGVESIEDIRSQAKAVWNANYCDDGAVKSVLANSVWLSDQLGYRQTTIERLADSYYASVYSGAMGSEEYDQALRDWLNAQTDNLLAEQAEGISMDPMTVISLASTINFRAKWGNEFSESNTSKDTFSTPDGDVICEFMHQSRDMEYCWGEGFGAISLSFENSGGMLLVLPDDGVSVDELLAEDEAMKLFLNGMNTTNRKRVIVNMSVPKFDVSSDIDLSDGLKSLGVTDVFSFEKGNFSPLTDEVSKIAVSKASHAARVQIDEEGCTAVAYTVMMACGAAMPPDEEVDFVLDRPFIFVIYGQDELPLFVGVVNQPV